MYLTADSPNNIEVLDPTKAYIIGGIVDRNRYKNLTLDKANKQGIAHAKLPIGEYLKLCTSSVLTVNHVFDILCEWYQTKSWKLALNKVVPERKQEKVDDETGGKVMKIRDQVYKEKKSFKMALI